MHQQRWYGSFWLKGDIDEDDFCDRLAEGRLGSADHRHRERKRRLPTSSTTNATDAPKIHALPVARFRSFALR